MQKIRLSYFTPGASVFGIVVFLVLVVAPVAWAAGPLPQAGSETGTGRYQNPVIEKKIDSLLALMTVAEKLGQLNQIVAGWDEKNKEPMLNDEQREQVKNGKVGSFLNVVGSRHARKIQKIAVDESRLHIPLIFGLDVIHGFRTIMPVPLAEACTWDPLAVEQSARIAAREATSWGINWTFAPMVDIARDPRWGRITEGSGEDPYLGSVLAAARVRGFQGPALTDTVSLLACAKHFAAYGGAEAGRDYNTVDLSERTVREVYLAPFRAAVDAGAGTLMSAFNEIGGIPASASPWLLTEVLRNEWGFQGYVVSDWSSIDELLRHGIGATRAEVGRKALAAGVDMDMMAGIYVGELPSLVNDGTLPIAVVNEAVRRVLRMKFHLGLFDDPYKNCREEGEQAIIADTGHRAFARAYAAKSIVLLKNDKNLLPIENRSGSVAVIGWLAQSKNDPLGAWHCEGKPDETVTILSGLKHHPSAAGLTMTYAPGYDSTFTDSAGFQEALDLARKADVVIVVAGERAEMSGEAASRSDIGLPGVQRALLERLVQTGKPVVLVLMNGRPLTLPWEAEHLPAIVETWFAGSRAGDAVADVLFGAVNPSGKLAATFPRSVGQIPLYYNHKNTGRPPDEKNKFTSKYLDVPNTPLYPFGYGLSYTTFDYGTLSADQKSMGLRDTVRVTVEVRNAGKRAGEEIVQFYIRDEAASVTRPVKELKGFTRIALSPGERKEVSFAFHAGMTAFLGERMKEVVEPGMITLMVGPDSEHLQEVHVELLAK